MKLPQIGHVGYIVENLDKSIEQYKEFYCIEEYVIYDFVPTKAWVNGKEIKDCKFRIAQLIPQEGAKLELIQVITGSTTPQYTFLKEKGQNINHVAYYVDDYKAWHDYYERLPGANIIFEIMAEDETMGRRASFYAAQEGTAGLIEISMKTKR